jgi:hypothetical protein
MRSKTNCVLTCLTIAFAAALALAEDLKLYPGAKLDQKASHDASSGRAHCQVYTTEDSFEKVYAFYRAAYKEVQWPLRPPRLPSGKDVQWAYFILDGGKDLAHSKYWLKIQRPFILTVGADDLDFKGIRDISTIQTVRRDQE